MGSIGSNLQEVKRRISLACAGTGRDANSVTLVAVSKTFDADAVRQAHAAGQGVFGENYVQEGADKVREIAIELIEEASIAVGDMMSTLFFPIIPFILVSLTLGLSIAGSCSGP